VASLLTATLLYLANSDTAAKASDSVSVPDPSSQSEDSAADIATEDFAGDELKPRPVLRRRGTWIDYVAALSVALIVAFTVRTCLVHAYRIPSASMESTLLIGDYVLANRLVFGAPIELPFSQSVIGRLPALRKPRRGEVAIFESWDGPDRDFIKRVVGVAGDTIKIVDGVLFINSRRFTDILLGYNGGDPDLMPKITRSSSFDTPWQRSNDFGPHVVGADAVFVMGDNRSNSQDSRVCGDVPLSRLKGKAVLIYWSWNAQALPWEFAKMVRWDRVFTLIR